MTPIVIPVNDLYYLSVVFKHYPPAPPPPVSKYIPLVLQDYGSGAPVGDIYEDDDSCSQAKPITLGQPQAHTFDPPYDNDWVKLDMVAGSTYVIQTGELIGDSDTIIELYELDCVALLAENDDYDGNLWSRIEWTATTAGTYGIRNRNYDPRVYGQGVGYTVCAMTLP